MDASLTFDNRFVAELPGDPETRNARRQVLGAAWSSVLPTPVPEPRLIAHSREMAEAVGFTPEQVASPEFARVFSGNALLPGMEPYAACYGGHQFGSWANQLGDGRAITLGEVVNPRGERWELQLKGAGPTPYSRTADGRAVLRSSIREFLCSEAMHHLGIPTTRALSLVGTGEAVMRDMFYDGNPRPEPGAVVCRVAPSFIRFGNFELPSARGDHALLEQLVDFTIQRDFPHLEGEGEERRAAWFREVCTRTAEMIVGWMRVGFVHGVMNTDNMSILGLTIDYGPYGWLDDFDPHWTPNTTDAQGRRYRFAQQPAIAQWNLLRLAEALRPLFPDLELLKGGLDAYVEHYTAGYHAMLAGKFGFGSWGDGERALVEEGFTLLHQAQVDYTLFFRTLGEVAGEGVRAAPGGSAPAADGGAPGDGAPAGGEPDGPAIEALLQTFAHTFYDEVARDRHAADFAEWIRRWQEHVALDGRTPAQRRAAMHGVNPRYVLRNYLAQEAIDLAEAGDHSRIHELLEVMRRPYDDQPGKEHFAARRPEWARHKAGCSMLSCSS